MYIHTRNLIPSLSILTAEGSNIDLFEYFGTYIDFFLVCVFLSLLSWIHENDLIILHNLCTHC